MFLNEACVEDGGIEDVKDIGRCKAKSEERWTSGVLSAELRACQNVSWQIPPA